MAQQPTVETSASSLKALKLLGIDGSADKLTKNSSSTSLNVNPRRLSLNPEARLEIGLRASDGVTSSGSNSLAALNLPKKSEIKPIVDELKLDIHFVEDRPGSIQSGSAAALLKLFSVLICDPKLSNEGTLTLKVHEYSFPRRFGTQIFFHLCRAAFSRNSKFFRSAFGCIVPFPR
jgi:hypothetical protein